MNVHLQPPPAAPKIGAPLSDAPPNRPHLRALAYAGIAAGSILAAGAAVGEHLVQRRVNALAPMLLPLKNQRVVLQQSAFARPDLLPFYGSSELVKPIPDKAAEFFRSYPTDFEVFPVGKAGTTSIIILEKLAAVGETLRGKKVAISLSPSWFMEPQIPLHYYEGNFSKLQAHELVFRSRLSWELKRDIAHRMLEFPETIARRPLLAFALRRLADGSKTDRLLFAAGWPFGSGGAGMLRAHAGFQ